MPMDIWGGQWLQLVMGKKWVLVRRFCGPEIGASVIAAGECAGRVWLEMACWLAAWSLP